jgi:hypothetical protein
VTKCNGRSGCELGTTAPETEAYALKIIKKAQKNFPRYAREKVRQSDGAHFAPYFGERNYEIDRRVVCPSKKSDVSACQI